MKQLDNIRLLTDDLLRKRIADICESITVVPLPKHFYSQISLDFVTKRRFDNGAKPTPVCITTPRLSPLQNDGLTSDSFELYTFYNWLRSGFRIIPNALPSRFEVFKGIGLSLPISYENTQCVIQDLYKYSLRPNPFFPDSPYGVLEIDSERRIGGAAYLSYAMPDMEGYKWLYNDKSVRIPVLQGLFSLSEEFCELLGITSATCVQIIRRFVNPFRISDLQLMMALSNNKNLRLPRSFWQSKAIAITTLSCDLAGFHDDINSYALHMSRLIGQSSASLINNNLLHGSLTDHCQNITLAGELTEFDWAVKIQRAKKMNTAISNFESRLYSQVLLFANHVRYFADCMNWIGISCRYIDYVRSFILGIKDRLSEEENKKLIYYFDTDPYCADLMLLAHSPFSEVNLKGCEEFISLLHKQAHEII